MADDDSSLGNMLERFYFAVRKDEQLVKAADTRNLDKIVAKLMKSKEKKQVIERFLTGGRSFPELPYRQEMLETIMNYESIPRAQKVVIKTLAEKLTETSDIEAVYRVADALNQQEIIDGAKKFRWRRQTEFMYFTGRTAYMTEDPEKVRLVAEDASRYMAKTPGQNLVSNLYWKNRDKANVDFAKALFAASMLAVYINPEMENGTWIPLMASLTWWSLAKYEEVHHNRVFNTTFYPDAYLHEKRRKELDPDEKSKTSFSEKLKNMLYNSQPLVFIQRYVF